MKKFLQKKLKDQKGMTLIELLAVIVIIAIIAAIAIPAIGNIIENSRFGAAKSDFQNAFAAASLYKADVNEIPSEIGDIDEYLEDSGTLVSLSFSEVDGVINIGGTFSVDGDETVYTLDSTTNATLSDMSVSEFKTEVSAE